MNITMLRTNPVSASTAKFFTDKELQNYLACISQMEGIDEDGILNGLNCFGIYEQWSDIVIQLLTGEPPAGCSNDNEIVAWKLLKENADKIGFNVNDYIDIKAIAKKMLEECHMDYFVLTDGGIGVFC